MLHEFPALVGRGLVLGLVEVISSPPLYLQLKKRPTPVSCLG